MITFQEDRHTLGVAEMDDTHREFVALAAALATADNEHFPALYAELFEHTRAHFAAEDARMRATRFPAIGEHTNEHQRVLGELMAFNRSVQAGRLQLARAYVCESLPGWFDLHLSTMDSALAAHLKRMNDI
ncbi:hemerythrin [Pseudothauera nasutitermitis]|uniref:Hemerythrin n=1 Tax=Pseudothauera nasutitermitis TaxID=2565930 RepID=A0A4S4AX62_9RHOO|nr:hemerythrin domain-containing protein [Pseudothauera nasutitermitis]THF64677.1 hemerythrin [Pseudothauera nasutitermitis]